MVRLTLLGLKKLGPEVAESGMMSGCTNWQLLTNVLVPTARRDILIGVKPSHHAMLGHGCFSVSDRCKRARH